MDLNVVKIFFLDLYLLWPYLFFYLEIGIFEDIKGFCRFEAFINYEYVNLEKIGTLDFETLNC